MLPQVQRYANEAPRKATRISVLTGCNRPRRAWILCPEWRERKELIVGIGLIGSNGESAAAVVRSLKGDREERAGRSIVPGAQRRFCSPIRR